MCLVPAIFEPYSPHMRSIVYQRVCLKKTERILAVVLAASLIAEIHVAMSVCILYMVRYRW